MVKFKVEFTIPAETLFSMIAKFLPIEDLHVEEVIEKHSIAQKKISTGPKKRHINWKPGAKMLIMEFFTDGAPHKAKELEKTFIDNHYAISGIGSLLLKLKKEGLIFQPDIGLWQLKQ